MKRYLFFMMQDHEENGGWHDLKGEANSVDECYSIGRNILAKDGFMDSYHIVDTKSGEIVEEGGFDNTPIAQGFVYAYPKWKKV